MPTVTPFLWYDDNLEAAIDFYQAVFDDMTVMERTRTGPADTDRSRGHGTPVLRPVPEADGEARG